VLSEPQGELWKSWVVELVGTGADLMERVGIEASAQTRGAADEAAERKLRRLLQLPAS
jgi:hypothetical protein